MEVALTVSLHKGLFVCSLDIYCGHKIVSGPLGGRKNEESHFACVYALAMVPEVAGEGFHWSRVVLGEVEGEMVLR